MTATTEIWWCLTFADPVDGFLGAAFVQAPTLGDAVNAATDGGWHPGGLELGIPFRAPVMDSRFTDRLLTDPEARSIPMPDDGFTSVPVAEATGGLGVGAVVQMRHGHRVMSGYALPAVVAGRWPLNA